MNDQTVPSNSDISLCLEQIQAGSEPAAHELVAKMTPFVMKIVRSHLPDRESEQDLAQKIFIKMFQKLDQYAATAPFEHWLSRIAVNTCLSQISSEKRRPELQWCDLSEEQASVMEALASTKEELNPADSSASRDLVERLLSALKPKERLLRNLLGVEGRTVSEIHELTGWTRPVIKIRAYRARARMRAQFVRLKENRS